MAILPTSYIYHATTSVLFGTPNRTKLSFIFAFTANYYLAKNFNPDQCSSTIKRPFFQRLSSVVLFDNALIASAIYLKIIHDHSLKAVPFALIGSYFYIATIAIILDKIRQIFDMALQCLPSSPFLAFLEEKIAPTDYKAILLDSVPQESRAMLLENRATQALRAWLRT